MQQPPDIFTEYIRTTILNIISLTTKSVFLLLPMDMESEIITTTTIRIIHPSWLRDLFPIIL